MTETTKAPAESFGDLWADIKFWVSKNNWAYWVIALFGVLGMVAVAWYLLRGQKPQTKAAPQ